MNLNEMYPSTWLKAEDFNEGQRITATIKDVRYETLGQGAKAEQKPVVDFYEIKPLVLNKTNAFAIGQLYGPDTDQWRGKTVELFTMEVDSFGDIVRAVRVRNKAPQNAPQAPQVAPMDNQPPQGQYAPSAPLNAQQAQARQQLNTGHQQPVAQSRGSFQPVNAYPADESDPFADDVQ